MEALLLFAVFGGIIGIILGIILGYIARQKIASNQAGTVEARINQLSLDTRREAQELLLRAKDKASLVVEEAKKEEHELKQKLFDVQTRLARREETVDRKVAEYEVKEGELQKKVEKVREVKEELEGMRTLQQAELERVAGLPKEKAKEELLSALKKSYEDELVSQVQKLEQNKRAELDKKALDLLVQSLQRYARSHTADFTTSVVAIPDDELKGRIIGREGRNIKTLERITGVEVIIDETPNVITLSAFDPIRREIAKIALEKLIKDGRIQPARIEQKVEEAKEEIRQKIQEAGERAVYDVGIIDFPPQVVHLLGRLNFRYSFGQNVLMHSVEAAIIAGMLAKELGADVEVAKKAALVHDIGKAVDHELQGTHVELGRKILQKYGVAEAVIHAMESHHDEYPYSSPEAFIVSAAESASAARTGARKDTLEDYIKRVESLERIANSFPGVEKTYAIQAGREIRVFVYPEQLGDLESLELAKKIAEQIESDLKYPGEIKVTVIRETRAVEYAK